MSANEITWDRVAPGDWISTGWGAQHRVRETTSDHVIWACQGSDPRHRTEQGRVDLNAGDEHRCESCERAGGPDRLGPSMPGAVGEVRRTPEGWIAVCFAEFGDRRWHFVGESPLGSYGWAPDWFMGNAEVIAVIPGTPAAKAEVAA